MPRLIFSAVVGSQAFGLARIDSDVDVRGMYAATLEEMLDPLVSVVGPDCKRNDEHDAYHHEFTHFLKLLGKQDVNAWQALVSRVGVNGNMAQGSLRRIALQHLLDGEVMLKKAEYAASTLMDEAARKQSGKLLAIGLRNLHFVQSVVQGLPGFAFDLGNLREALVTLIDNWNVDEARLLYNEIIGRQVETTPRHDNAVIRRQALVEYYHYHCL